MANLLDPNAEAPAKKSRLEQFGAAAPAAMQGNEAISEEAVRRWLIVLILVLAQCVKAISCSWCVPRYLKRRPMTTTDLLKKFRSKKTGIQNAQLVLHLLTSNIHQEKNC